MGILSGIFKARDKPSNATAGSAYRFLFGGSTSGKAVTAFVFRETSRKQKKTTWDNAGCCH